MKQTVTYGNVLTWTDNCEELISLFQHRDDLTMDMEWTLLYNYRQLINARQKYDSEKDILINKFGTLQADGSTILDETSETTMRLYHEALDKLNSSNIRINIEKISHVTLRGLPGKSLEIMALIMFMIY